MPTREASKRSRRHGALAALLSVVVAFWGLGTSELAVAGAPPAGALIRNVATATYTPFGFGQLEISTSNAVTATVLPVEALLLSQDQAVNRPPGVVVTLGHLLANSGNVASSYTVSLTNDGIGCAADTLDLTALRVVRDNNGNGVADAGEPALPLDTAGVVTLGPAETVALLVQGTVPAAASGSACVTLSAATALQAQRAANHDVVTLGNVAVLTLLKSASFGGAIIPGQTRIDFSIAGSNIGAQSAQPSGLAAPAGTSVRVNGVATALVLLRDLVPAGTQLIAGSLQGTGAASAIRLFRLPGDAPFDYRTTDDASAVEVAIGLPTPIAPGASVAMQFAVKARTDLAGDIVNTAQGYYGDAVQPVVAQSNTVVIAANQGRIGVAKQASTPRPHRAPDGSPDGTADVRFSVNIRNYGSTALYGVQAADAMEGGGPTQFGTHVGTSVPGLNQYTVIAGSVGLAAVQNNAQGGTGVAVNAAFDGTAAHADLLAPGAVLPVGAQVTVQFDVRVNLTGRTGSLLNGVRASAALAPGGGASVFDDSVDGVTPDADGDGNPGNDSSATPVSTALPALTLVKSAAFPRRVAPGVYDIDYTLRVTNSGQSVAPNVRVIDNLNCTFDMDKPEGLIESWALQAPPKMVNGLLDPAPGFTGRANCDRSTLESADAFALPTEAVLSTTDGSRALMPGQSESVTFTVRVTKKPATAGRASVTNKAWAAALDRNTMSVTPTMLVAAGSGSVRSLLADPQGTVYNAVTRQPVAGSVVTFTRQSCSGGPVTPFTPAEVYGSESGTYTFNADGSMSMTTGADGAYQFFLLSPPAAGLCTYGLAVSPPAGSGYVYPSQIVPVTGGSFSGCSAITPNAAPPQGSEPTTHYLAMLAGFQPDGSACDVTHNHIPLDPGNVLGLVLRKDGSKRQIEFGDFMDYALTVTNKTGVAVNGIHFIDSLPPGFAYVPNTARLNGAVAPNPGGASGPVLNFSYPDLTIAVDQSVMVRYRVRVGVGAPTNGDATNRARASSGPMVSNLAIWTVRVTGGVFSDDAFAFGKVYLDCKRDGVQQGVDEIGVPGVRLYLENGTHVVTDVEGKWSLYGLRPVTHVLRLDQTTLPVGARLEALDHRNAGTPESRFVDLKKGEFHKADFVIANCEDAGVVRDVMARRAAIAARPDTEADAQVRVRLDPEGKAIAVGDVRALPASGQSLASGSTGALQPTSAPLIAMPAAAINASTFVGGAGGPGGGTLGVAPAAVLLPFGGIGTGGSNGTMPEARSLPLLPQAAPGAIDLEVLLPQIDDNALGFIGLKNGDTVAGQSINVRVKGEAGATLRLSVDGVAIDDRRVGKKTVLPSKKIAAWEYIGIALKPGANTLKLEAVDGFGNVRGAAATVVVTAPDRLGAIHVDLPESARADLRTPVVVKVRLVDAAGVPVTARTQLTLESDLGRWLDDDLNPLEPGTQVFMDGGAAGFRLMPPGEPGDARIRVSAGNFVREVRLPLLPEMRPMIGVGIVEGVLDFTRRGGLTLGAMPAGGAFEQELSSLKADNGAARGAGRAAFFFKGTVKGDYLLTASLDTDKSPKDRLFRDIRPDEFYPVYGDSAVKGFDAQSTQKLYVRIDKNRSYLLYGDFTTVSSTEVRSLSQSNRSLTGLKQVYEDERLRATSYVSRTAQVQQIEEFRALGTSGPYYLSATGGEFVDNSEQVEIVVRDRNQPAIVLQRTPAARFVDYTIEPLTRRLLFTHPISSVDPNLNPQSIRVTYEVDSGGPKFTVAGTDVQVRVTDRLQLGVVANIDQNPENRRKLGALTAVGRIGDRTTVAGELVETESDLNGKGHGGRIESRYQGEKLAVVALGARTSEGFDNPGASFSAGRTEASARAEYKVDPSLAVRAEALYSKDALQTDQRNGASVSVQKKLGGSVVVEGGVRRGQANAPLGTSTGFDYGQISGYNGQMGSTIGARSTTALGAAVTAEGAAAEQADSLTTLRARVSSQVPWLPQAQLFVEAEQDIKDGDRHTLAVGGNYAVTDKTRVYGRYELVSTLDRSALESTSVQPHNVGVMGVESAYMEGGRVYNEYRIADTAEGRATQAAIGIRNSIRLNDRLRATGGVEHTRNLGAASNSVNSGNGYTSTALGASTAVTGGLEYITGKLKASGVVEARRGDDADTLLISAGVGYKITPDLSVLARSVVSNSEGQGTNAGNARRLQRHQIGLAYRPVDSNSWNALARYEHRAETVVGGGNSAGVLNGSSVFGGDFGNATLPGIYSADIVSAHLNFTPERGTAIVGRYAAKVSRADDREVASSYWAHLVQARYTRDLGSDWDVGVQAALLYGKGGGLQKSAGVELGYQAYKNLWLSGGFNFIGLSDRDLTANEYTSKGAYLRLRFKFDETGLGFASAGAVDATATASTSTTAATAVATTEPLPPVTTFQAGALFAADRSLIDTAAHPALDKLVARIQATQDDIVIAISTERLKPPGSADAIADLAMQRVNALRGYLVSRGVAATRIRTDPGSSESRAGSHARAAAGNAMQRRIDIESR